MTTATAAIGSPELARALQRVESRKRLVAIALTLPLLLFLLATFLVPIGALLVRAIENPEVAASLGRTGQALSSCDARPVRWRGA
jgi:putative spermidine/putrescine transport system permease protein